MATQVYFAYLETIELSYDVSEYFSNAWNNIDVPIFFICLYYFILRITNLDKNYFPMSERPSV